MFRPIRTLISIAFVGLLVWFAFSVPLGPRTLAEHIDRIGATPEAQDLVDGTRRSVNPLLREATDRVLGEYVEAPTHLPAPDGPEAQAQVPTGDGSDPEVSTPEATKLPGAVLADGQPSVL